MEQWEMDKRGGFDAYGQTLPDWLTYTEVVTTVDGQTITTGQVEQLPQTYYGPSIPLGPGWVYGGTTSLTATPTSTSSTTFSSTTTEDLTTETSLTASSTPISSSILSSQLSSSATSTTSISSSSAFTSSSTTSFSQLLTSSPSLSPISSSGTTSNPFIPDASTTSPSGDRSPLLPFLPALLVPLLVVLLILLIAIYLYRRHRTYQPSTIHSPSAPRFIPAFLIPILYPRNGYAPGTAHPPSTPPKKQRVFPLPPNTSVGLRSPNEKSALLMGFTPQHHRNSSSISRISEEDLNASGTFGAGGATAGGIARGVGEENTAHEEQTKDQARDIAPQATSLLRRLTLGLGIFGTGTSEPRKPSGFLLERGFRRSSYTAVPTSLPPPRPSSKPHPNPGQRDARIPNSNEHASENTTPEAESSAQETSSGAFHSIPDSQLFYAPPAPTASSKGSSSRTPSSAGLTPWIKATPSRSTRPSGEGGRWGGDEISVGVPETPGTVGSRHAVEGISGDLGEFGGGGMRWNSGERMRFPIPPGGVIPGIGLRGRRDGQGTFGEVDDSRRESILTSGTGDQSFQTARSEQPTTVASDNLVPVGNPINRAEEDYRHAALSAFGSYPSTPTHAPLRPLSCGQLSSNDHASSPGHSTELSAPRLSPPTIALLPLSPFGPAREASTTSPKVTSNDAPGSTMRGLFTLSPPSSAGFSGESSGRFNVGRRSFQGEPMLDISTSRGVVTPRVLGEFGEPHQPGPEISPTILVAPDMIPDRSSETASVYSQPSNAPSGYGTSSSGSSAGHGGTSGMPSPAIRDRAIRGRRSQPQLVRASMLGAPVVEETVPPVPPVLSVNAPLETRQQHPGEKTGKGWFGRLR